MVNHPATQSRQRHLKVECEELARAHLSFATGLADALALEGGTEGSPQVLALHQLVQAAIESATSLVTQRNAIQRGRPRLGLIAAGMRPQKGGGNVGRPPKVGKDQRMAINRRSFSIVEAKRVELANAGLKSGVTNAIDALHMELARPFAKASAIKSKTIKSRVRKAYYEGKKL